MTRSRSLCEAFERADAMGDTYTDHRGRRYRWAAGPGVWVRTIRVVEGEVVETEDDHPKIDTLPSASRRSLRILPTDRSPR